MDLRCRLDKVLKMGACKEVSEVDKFAVVLVLDVNNSPSILSPTNLFSTNND
jgi:hypothetical protein